MKQRNLRKDLASQNQDYLSNSLKKKVRDRAVANIKLMEKTDKFVIFEQFDEMEIIR